MLFLSIPLLVMKLFLFFPQGCKKAHHNPEKPVEAPKVEGTGNCEADQEKDVSIEMMLSSTVIMDH